LNKLNKVNNTYKCSSKHSFDISKEGYINLLLNKSKAGDNQEMIKARKEFLEKGYFNPLVDGIINTMQTLDINNPNIIDIGCADGYYTYAISKHYPKIIGLDISKDAIKYAARKYKDILFVVANAKKLPIQSEEVDIALNIFAPHFLDELKRVLKNGGYIIKATPNKKHLFELKEIIYENTYLTKEKQINEDDLILVKSTDLNYKKDIMSQDLINLFKMTPYTYKTKQTDIDKLKQIKKLLITFDFNISVYKKTFQSFID
ncbi:MAG TPA: methyltransferase domain-containing protein, partial [Gallicola sp.]|nr:methyltransferase domain-containing protein [Gallicola sp.]